MAAADHSSGSEVHARAEASQHTEPVRPSRSLKELAAAFDGTDNTKANNIYTTANKVPNKSKWKVETTNNNSADVVKSSLRTDDIVRPSSSLRDIAAAFSTKNDPNVVNDVRTELGKSKNFTTSLKFGGGDKCSFCGKTAYDTEKLKWKDAYVHDTCFRCSECKVRLIYGAQVDHEGELYCQSCHDAKFGSKGFRQRV